MLSDYKSTCKTLLHIPMDYGIISVSIFSSIDYNIAVYLFLCLFMEFVVY